MDASYAGRRMRSLTIAVIALAFAVVAAPSAEARKYCGKVTTKYSYGSFDHKTYLIKGKMSCRSVRSVMRRSIPHDGRVPGWKCVALHLPPPYDVTCTNGSRKVGAITEL
jgi:hypothetical protein